MVQGAVKKSAKAAGPARKSNNALKPRGSRIIAPKKPKLIQQRKLHKKHTAGLTGLTEKKLAERAGHLEILRGGKKEREEKAKEQASGKSK